MNKHLKIIFIVAIFVFPLVCFSQEDDKGTKIVGNDTTISTPFFAGAGGWTFPFGDMGKQYKSFFNIDANLGWKTKSNWLYMLDFAFQFGSNNVKNIDGILSTLETDDQNSFIVSQDGTDAGVVGYNRNLSLSFGIGKLIPLWFSNPNSGLFITLNGGYIQHQIIYQATLGKVPQLEGDYAYGYDRQMRGPMVSSMIGYMHISKKSYANWYVGAQFYAAFTKMSRKYQFDLMSGDNTLHHDYMLSLKLGWMFPFFGRSADKIYFY
ncbi:MAG: hypothetical protein LKE30_07560 [Bacteroidales bacterium]|jgi:hypothetical protein|nr:hypothetical protein [Bacteroidales bacterium]